VGSRFQLLDQILIVVVNPRFRKYFHFCLIAESGVPSWTQ
jgi:hypothetical protein